MLVRVVFGLDRQPSLVRTVRRALWNGETDQDASDFETEVVVEAPGRVLLDGEGQRLGCDTSMQTEIVPQRVAACWSSVRPR